jgi:hypothetical protein
MVFNAKEYRKDNPEERDLPVGWYKVFCEMSELKKSSMGHDMVVLKIRIVDSISGHFINALQWENLVIGHPSELTRKYANDKLAEIMLACCIETINVWGDLSNSPEFAMSIGKSAKTGNVYAVYRPLSAYLAVQAKQGIQPAPLGLAPAYQELTPPRVDDHFFDDDLPY